MRKKTNYLLLLLLSINLSGYSQYRIHGYIAAEEKNKIIYLSLLRYNEENAIYPEQVLTSTKTDSTGYFEITGKLLADENKLYRIHSNTKESEPLLEFVETGCNKNHHNFIFSNHDTLFFPKSESIWFSNAKNTNIEDQEWRRAITYEQELLQEYSNVQNADAILEAERRYLDEYKLYCSDSLSGPLVKLLGFAHLRRNTNISTDFKNAPGFYYDLLDELKRIYGGTSYFVQFQDEILRLSASFIEQKYLFHKKLNYIFGGLILILFTSLILLFYKLRKQKTEEINSEVYTLTKQEEKVAKLICEGKSNKEIGSELFVSLSTVKSHIGNINSKLNVKSRKQLIDKLKKHPWD